MAQEQVKSYYFEDLEVGLEGSLTKSVAEADIMTFAGVSGDSNPVHIDAEYAAGTMFKERISHGMLTASYVSAVFGMKLPGPGAIYISQTLNFKRPVKIGDTITARVTLKELDSDKRRARFDCVCENQDGKAVLDGQAELMVPLRPKS